ncbi:MAG: outer membrane protein assembly factor BamD [Tannerella sp.]|jgi:outer membrane protein assembly factor BamD|nr:outer membrane protein assembly factor BamD [Tannerella sp.]
MKKIIVLLSVMMLLLSSCGEYNKLLKSQDADMKYSYAKKYFNQKKYVKSATLLEEIVQYFRGRTEAEESLYLLAQSYYGQKDYVTASEYFKTYYTTYPKGEFAELSRFYGAYGLYLDSPDPRLDQAQTHESIRQFLLYMEYYPQSERAKEAQDILFELQEKLAYKEYLAAKLYYNLGTYMGNNYGACVITADNALKNYPDTRYREELIYLMVASKYELAIVSINERLQGRYREVVDEYYNYMNEFPEGKYVKQVKKYFDYANNKIEKNY